MIKDVADLHRGSYGRLHSLYWEGAVPLRHLAEQVWQIAVFGGTGTTVRARHLARALDAGLLGLGEAGHAGAFEAQAKAAQDLPGAVADHRPGRCGGHSQGTRNHRGQRRRGGSQDTARARARGDRGSRHSISSCLAKPPMDAGRHEPIHCRIRPAPCSSRDRSGPGQFLAGVIHPHLAKMRWPSDPSRKRANSPASVLTSPARVSATLVSR